jgi:hypothetical protein|tara:strand:- start:20 stop:505 length:486 start_codon:yes stop_codon:yes gene_type:complete
MSDKYQGMMTKFMANMYPDMYIETDDPDVYQAVLSPQKIKGFQNYIDRLRKQDEQKMEDLAIERSVISQGMLSTPKELEQKGQFSGNPTESIMPPPSEKPGYTMAEGSNFWSVNTEDPYWDTEEGYQEALNLYGESPAWSSNPMEQENNFASFEAPRRISL